MDAWKISKSTIVYFEDTYFQVLSFCNNYWVNDHLFWLICPAILPERAYEVVPTEQFAKSISYNKRITRKNMLKQKGHSVRPNSSVD